MRSSLSSLIDLIASLDDDDEEEEEDDGDEKRKSFARLFFFFFIFIFLFNRGTLGSSVITRCWQAKRDFSAICISEEDHDSRYYFRRLHSHHHH